MNFNFQSDVDSDILSPKEKTQHAQLVLLLDCSVTVENMYVEYLLRILFKRTNICMETCVSSKKELDVEL